MHAGARTKMPKGLELLTLGIHLGGSKILAAVVNPRGEMLSSDEDITPATEGRKAVIQSIVDSSHRVLEQADVAISELIAIGVGAPGLSNPETGILFTSANLPGWRNVPVKDIMQKRLGKEAFVINDTKAAALGEFCFGAARGARNFIYVTLSTGIGGGIVIDGNNLYWSHWCCWRGGAYDH